MFTETGEITYGAEVSLLHSWGPSNSIVRAIILAFLTTLLSYQLTAAIVDIAFGTKKHGFARIRDIQILLLTRRQSPYAVARCLFRRLPFSKLPNYDSHDPHGRLRPTTVIKLLTLFLVAPIVNVAAIILALEFETDFSFRQLEFGGLAFGIDMNATRAGYRPVSQICVRAPVSLARAEVPLAEFAICDTPMSAPGIGNVNATVHVEASSGTSLQLVVQLPFVIEASFSVAHIINNDPQLEFPDRYNFRLPYSVTNSSIRAVADVTMSRVQEICGGGPVESFEPETVSTASIDQERVDAAANLRVPCDIEDTEEVRDFLKDILDETRTKFVFVDSDELSVRVTSENKTGEANERVDIIADNENFVRRRNAYADIFLLFIITVATVIVRMATRFLTRNDLPRGIGLIIREELGIPCCDSMLPNRDVVASYSGLAHFGVRYGEDDD